ncbi:MAG TPA: hypothetical protein VFG99_03450, partial [Chloroflexia bacterium]|nr:hypothetical protein [Chloroflexia bacterium]
DHREAEKTRRRQEQQAAHWVANDRKGTLLGGADLDEAEKWLDGVAARDVGYDEEVRTFVNESLKADEKRKQDRELELKRAQELAKERLESAQRLRTRLVMAVAALLVTVIALVFAWSEYQMAQTQLRFAKMQALANQSVAELARDPQLSLLLALDAVGIARGSEDPVPSEVKSALQQATDESRVHATLCCHTGQVHSVAYGPPGTRLIVSAAGDNTPILWDTQTLTRTGLLGSLDGQDGHTDAVLTARFSPDGRHIVTGSRDHEVKIWDAATRTVSTTLKKHGGSVSSVAFSPDGRHLATASRDKTVLIWSATAAEYEQEGEAIKPGIGELVSVAWSP